jgi:plastocyanin
MKTHAPVVVFLTAALTFLASAPAASQTGTIAGTVSLEGAAPAIRSLTVTKNQDVCGQTVPARDLVVTGGKVAFAVVSVEDAKGTVQPTSVLLSNTHCMFDPPQLAAAVGDTLVVDNQDEVLHNTHLALQFGSRVRTVGNWGLSNKGFSIRAEGPLRLAGTIEVSCDAHPWMSARILVFGHPYFATSDQKGAFEIRNVPAGTHAVKVHHPVLGELEQTVIVKPGATTTVMFAYPAQRAREGEKRAS